MKNNILFSNNAKLPTPHGVFDMVSFKKTGESFEHLILSLGDIKGKEKVLLRVHSECLTGDVFSSLKCDCGEQLSKSLKLIAEKKQGVIVYLKQEGRGIGLFNKVNAYALQDAGQDTIEANHSLGFETDLRNYDVVADVIQYLKLKSVELLSNNPEKIEAVLNATQADSISRSIKVSPNTFNSLYLKVKKNVLKHNL